MTEIKSENKSGEKTTMKTKAKTSTKKKIVKASKGSKKSSLKVFLVNIIVFVLLCFVLIWGVMHWLDDYTNHDNIVKVPNLENLREAQVKSVLDSRGLRYKIVDSIHIKNKPKGVVIEQKPPLNAKAKVGRIVFLTINSFSEELVALPNVKDYSQRQANAVIKAVGLKLGTPDFQNSKYKGLVFGVKYKGKEIEPGTKIPVDDSVSLIVGN